MPLSQSERDYFRSPNGKIAIVVITGDLVEITYVGESKEIACRRKGRVVSSFTNAARLRMLRMVARVDWQSVGRSLFITLTYPDGFANGGHQDCVRQRYVFRRAMENYLGKKVGVLWRVEWKARKSGANVGGFYPHCHLIVFNVPFLPHSMVRSWWRNAIHASGPLATDVQRIDGARSVAKYVCKYAAKREDVLLTISQKSTESIGRHWGVCRRECIPWCERKVYYNPPAEFIRLLENGACSVLPFFPRDASVGFTLFGNVGKALAEEMQARGIDDLARVWYSH